MNACLNAAVALKHFEWSVRLKKHYINARPFHFINFATHKLHQRNYLEVHDKEAAL